MTDYTDRRYIPEGATLIDSEGTDTAIYTYESNGTPMAIAYHGKAGKSDWHYRFRSTEERAARIAKTIAHWHAIAAMKARHWRLGCRVSALGHPSHSRTAPRTTNGSARASTARLRSNQSCGQPE